MTLLRNLCSFFSRRHGPREEGGLSLGRITCRKRNRLLETGAVLLFQGLDFQDNRAIRAMGARQLADAHQELPDDLTTGEFEGLLEDLYPGRLVGRLLTVQPLGERAVIPLNHQDSPGIFDDRLDLAAMTHHAGIA